MKNSLEFSFFFKTQLYKFKHYKLIVLFKGNKINGFERN